MNSKPLYAVTALFETPDSILDAAEKTKKAGYTEFDVHTPYPVHGMDKTMGLRPSKIGYFTFAFGLTGALAAIILISWITISNYPLVIGGKPFWSWPAFVPITFEVTVLIASVLSTIVMIALFFKFPNISHPLHDTDYMKSVSRDSFGICIKSQDPLFNSDSAKKFLKELGGKSVDVIFFEPEETDSHTKIFDAKFAGVLVVTALVVSAATYFTLNKLMYMQPFNWMMIQNKVKAQQPSVLFEDGFGMRMPVEGTIAKKYIPYAYKDKPEEAARSLYNPSLSTPENINSGRIKFLTYCSPCHGNFADGDSRLRGQFPNPPTLHSEKVRQWPDGRIFHVITEGQNAMPVYAQNISTKDRWYIIKYIRVLQRARHAKESDLK